MDTDFGSATRMQTPSPKDRYTGPASVPNHRQSFPECRRTPATWSSLSAAAGDCKASGQGGRANLVNNGEEVPLEYCVAQ